MAMAERPTITIPDNEPPTDLLIEGESAGQGIGYLDDGTMVVVDNARKMIGKTIDIVVTSVLQTTAGKMIFGRFIEPATAAHRLRQPEITLDGLRREGHVTIETTPETEAIDVASVETTLKYAGYLKRQDSEIARVRRDEGRAIPNGFPFRLVPGLSREIVQRLLPFRDEIPELDQVPRRVAVEGEFREEHQVGAAILRAPAPLDHLGRVGGVGSDGRVDLGQGSAHGQSLPPARSLRQ